MAKYRKIDVRIWNDAKFRSMSDDGKLLFMLLMTHSNQTMLGAMRAGRGSLAEDLGWAFERLSKALDEALDKGMVKHDTKALLIWLPNFLKYNNPESPNVVKAWPSAYELLPECELKHLVWRGCESFVKGMGESFRKAFDSLPKGYSEDYAESGAGAGTGTGIKTGGAQDAPSPPVENPKPAETRAEPKPFTPPLAPKPEGELSPQACAKAMFEHLAIVAPAKTLKLAADAIRMLATTLCTQPLAAMLVIRRKAELAIHVGETVNGFWFEDSKWKDVASPAAIGMRVADSAPEPAGEIAPEGVDTELGERIWTGMSKALKSELGAQSFETWIRPIKPLGALNGELYLSIPNHDFAHVQDRYEIAKYLPEGVAEIHMLSRSGAAA